MITIKTIKEIKIMDDANKIVHNLLSSLDEHIIDGVTTKYIDQIVEKNIPNNAAPAFKNYNGYPAVSCISINEEVVHGIPGDKIIRSGDIVSVDIGIIYNGFVGDAAKTFIVGDVDDNIKNLVCHTNDALTAGIEKMCSGNTLYDINKAIGSIAKKYKYGNIVKFCGHGVGRKMHEDPAVFNYENKNEPNVHLVNGIVFAIEPMFSLGTGNTEILSDGWTVITQDKSISAHWEVSVAIVNNRPYVLGKNHENP